MNECKQATYRQLLYQALLDIRMLCAARQGVGLNPLAWYQRAKSARLAGELADCMHNLARCSAHNFDSFDEMLFWDDVRLLTQRFPKSPVARYRGLFKQSLSNI